MGGGGRGLKEIGLYVFRFENGCTPVSIKSWVVFLGCLVDSTSSDKSSSDAAAAATLRTGLPDLGRWGLLLILFCLECGLVFDWDSSLSLLAKEVLVATVPCAKSFL